MNKVKTLDEKLKALQKGLDQQKASDARVKQLESRIVNTFECVVIRCLAVN